MAKLNQLFSILMLGIILYGCCSTSTITVTEIDTIIVNDTIHLVEIDSIWHGGIYSGTDSIGSLAVSPKSKTAVVNIKWLKPDTVLVPVNDTKYIVLPQTIERVLSALFLVMPFWQKLIIIIGLIGALFVVYKLWSKK